MSLQDKAMLISLSVTGWSARKLDRKVTEEVDQNHGAKDAGRYNKLLVDKQFLDPLTQHAGAMRTYFYKVTLPWMDNGARLLPSRHFMEFSGEMRKLRDEYERRIDTFVDLYDRSLVADARRRLGTMYDPADYPPGSELRKKFSITTDIMPVPSGEDFRVSVGDSERARIVREMEDRVRQRQEAAQKDAWARIREAVGRYTKIGGDKAKIFDSMVENAEELTRLLPGLNVNEDPQMDRVCQAIIDELLVDVARLRRSAAARRDTVAAAERIMAMCPRNDG